MCALLATRRAAPPAVALILPQLLGPLTIAVGPSPTAMATVAVLGATGGTGLEVVKQALAGGSSVRVLVRAPEKLKIQHERLTVMQGNALDAADVDKVRP